MRRLTTLLVLASRASVGAYAEMPTKKLIATGWDSPRPEQLRGIVADVEAAPSQGIVVSFVGRGGSPHYAFAFTPDEWDEARLGEVREDLQATRFSRPMDNFLMVNANPGSVDWFDDASWVRIVEHWRAAARLAREAGLRGILFDPEPYAEPYQQFGYNAQAGAAEHSFDEYRAKARERGREVMTAVAEEYPDIVVFCYFMLSWVSTSADRPDPSATLAGSGYGLYPAFIDGWLDVTPPTVTFIDGCESAYLFNSEIEYLDAANRIKGVCQSLISPENRYRYRAQVQVSFGVYLDAYVNPPDSPYYIDPGEQSPVERLRRNVETALRVADEYVWIYGETASWWPTPNDRANARRWWDAMPGIVDALNSLTDPEGVARRLIAEDGRENLLKNPSFSEEDADGGPPAGWSFWQEETSSGTPSWDQELGAACLGGVRNGCLIQSIDVSPSRRYVVAARTKAEGAGAAWLRVRWQTSEGKWHAEQLDKILAPKPTEGEWSEILGIVTVPEGAGKLVVLLGASGQGAADRLWYDDVTVVRLDDE